jgi:acetyl esterase
LSPVVLDPQLAELLRIAEEAGGPPVGALPPDEARAGYAVVAAAQFGPVDEVFAVEDRDADGVPVRLYRPVETTETSAALVYFHGGGWVIGNVDTHDGMTRAFARRAGVVVVSVDYRLAPEHPYPAAVEDAWASASWVLAHARDLGIDAGRVAVGGDSAGGTLAAVVARRGRDAGTPFAAQLLLYPVISSLADSASYELFATGYGLTAEGMRWYWRQYISDRDGGEDPEISPLALAEAKGLPPAIVITAEADVLRDEGEAYAALLAESGVEIEQRRYPGMIHGFLRMPGVVDSAGTALDEVSASLARSLGAS